MRKRDSNYMEAAILGASGLIAFTIIGLIVYAIGLVFGVQQITKPFVDEIVIIMEFPLFFVAVAGVKIMIGGKIIERTVKAVTKIFGIKKKIDSSKVF